MVSYQDMRYVSEYKSIRPYIRITRKHLRAMIDKWEI
jgi:hypothetical protein